MSDEGMDPAKLPLLAEAFDRAAVHWRAQTVANGKALALAYIDARDVMDRLDSVCGPENWQDRYEETPKGRIIGTLSINVGGYWVNKSDGAGNTDVEGDKGALSDALKRTAVKWGIGRYLYDMPNVWVPCEVNQQGKFKKFTDDPWKFVRGIPAPKAGVNDNRELILTLAQSAGVGLPTIYESYGAASIAALTDEQAKAAVKRLQLTIKDKQKENA